jgi:molecular chaperone DnaK (HSP70)
MYLGLDFGTTSTVVSVASADGDARVLSVAPFSFPKKFRDDFDHVVPSTISFGHNEEVVVGAEVLAASLLHAEGTFRWMKPYLTGTYMDFPRRIHGKEVNNRAAARKFLRQILHKATQAIGPISHVCATTPVAAFGQYQEWLSDAIQDCGLPRPSFIDEPTAASVCVAGNRNAKSISVVVDFGGGTLDVAIVSRPSMRRGKMNVQKIKVHGNSGAILGGREIDAWLAQTFLEQLGLPISGNSDISLNELLVNCESAKELLTFSDTATVACISASDGEVYDMSVSRTEFERLLRERGLFDRIRDTLSTALSHARENDVSQTEISDVILIGGSSQIPSVATFIKEQFPNSVVRTERPFSAVSLGAARVAAGYSVEARTFHEYSIRYLDDAGTERFDVIVPAGQPIPSYGVWSKGLISTLAGQTLFNIEVYQQDEINRRWHKKITDIIFGRDGKAIVGSTAAPAPKLSRTPLKTTGIVAAPSTSRGEKCLIACFDIDENRRLLLTVDDIRTKPEIRLVNRLPMAHLSS